MPPVMGLRLPFGSRTEPSVNTVWMTSNKSNCAFEEAAARHLYLRAFQPFQEWTDGVVDQKHLVRGAISIRACGP